MMGWRRSHQRLGISTLSTLVKTLLITSSLSGILWAFWDYYSFLSKPFLNLLDHALESEEALVEGGLGSRCDHHLIVTSANG